ncbi:MAG: cytochrome c maturation protein CcmE [Deltaproteobacteria bacterium]|nr:cytochrome c maturation protein CcmE [Deltaproteobacteria bacterium]
MKINKLPLLGGVLLLAFAGFTLASFKETITPYVAYDQARTLKRTVQVAGGLQPNSSDYDNERQALLFTLTEAETKETLRVRYEGVKPANFEEAISIVAIGRFDEGEGLLVAEKLLVKCPSKYMGTEMEEKVYG